MATKPTKTLQTVPNPKPARSYEILIETDEFTCLCPITGQPDFATVTIRYIPDRLCVELKSLKLYLWSYRDEGVFHEAVTNRILDDLVAALRPRRMTVTSAFRIRGGIRTTVEACHETVRRRRSPTKREAPKPARRARVSTRGEGVDGA